MSTLFGINFPSLVSGVFAGQLEAGTLHAISETINDYGEPVRTPSNTAIEGAVSRWEEATRVSRGYPLEAVRIIMLAHGKPKPEKGRDEITIRSTKFRVVDVMDGGAEAIWIIAGVKA